MFGSLLNWDSGLWSEVDRLQREMNDLFNRDVGWSSIRAVNRGAFPALNVGVTPEAVHVYAFIPGVDPKTLELSIQRNLLTIAGTRQLPEPASGSQRYLQERFDGSFRRVVTLPEDVDSNQVNAAYRDGVLQISIAKQEAAKPRQIQVHA